MILADAEFSLEVVAPVPSARLTRTSASITGSA
jgi:hypothetical protein